MHRHILKEERVFGQNELLKSLNIWKMSFIW